MSQKLRLLERLELIVPGFKGYKEKEIRREQDKALRIQLARALDGFKYDLIGMEEEYSEDLKRVKDIETVIGRVQKLTDKVEHADYGYAGFFDLIHIDEDKLDQLYQHDVAMFDLIEQVKGQEEVEVLKAKVKQMEEEWDKREEICMS